MKNKEAQFTYPMYIYSLMYEPAIKSENVQFTIPASFNARPSREKMNPKYSCVIHAVSLKYVHTGGEPEDKFRYARAKENWASWNEKHADAQSTL